MFFFSLNGPKQERGHCLPLSVAWTSVEITCLKKRVLELYLQVSWNLLQIYVIVVTFASKSTAPIQEKFTDWHTFVFFKKKINFSLTEI